MTFFINPVEQTTSDSKENEYLENTADIIDFNIVSHDRKENGFKKPNETEIEVEAVDDNTCNQTHGNVLMNRLLNIKGPEIFEIAASRVKESQSITKCVKGSLILGLVAICLFITIFILNSMPKPGYVRDLESNVTILERKLADLQGSGTDMIDKTKDILNLHNGHYIKCFGGLSVSDTTIACTQPLFDSEKIVGSVSKYENGNKMLGLYNAGDGYSASHDWLEKNVGVLFGKNNEVPSRSVQMNESPWGCAGSNENEYCYSGGDLSLYVDSSCNGFKSGKNGCNVVTSFSFTYIGGIDSAKIIGSTADECTFTSVSSCPTISDLKECHKGMNSGELCEADKTLPDGNSNYDINNCGGHDVFKCIKGT